MKRWQNMPSFRRDMILRKLERMRQMPPERREMFLEQKPFWQRLNEEQKKGLRELLFSENSPLKKERSGRGSEEQRRRQNFKKKRYRF
jgi:hypothetical protein